MIWASTQGLVVPAAQKRWSADRVLVWAVGGLLVGRLCQGVAYHWSVLVLAQAVTVCSAACGFTMLSSILSQVCEAKHDPVHHTIVLYGLVKSTHLTCIAPAHALPLSLCFA